MNDNEENPLDKVASRVAEANDAKKQEAVRQREEKIRKDTLFQKAKEELKNIQDTLYNKIKATSDEISISGHELTFGDGEIEFMWPVKYIPSMKTATRNGNHPTKEMYKELGYEAIAGTYMYVTYKSQNYSHSATLLYLKEEGEKQFRWYQLAFSHSVLARSKYRLTSPFYLEPNNVDIYLALSPGIHVINVVYGPNQIDGDSYRSFEHQWLSLLAIAAVGELSQ